jgi:hypothetical protein
MLVIIVNFFIGNGNWGQGDKRRRGEGDKRRRGQGDKGTRRQGDKETNKYLVTVSCYSLLIAH